MKTFTVLLFAAMPMLAQSAVGPVAQIAPPYPREGQPVIIAWIQIVDAPVRFGTPTAVVTSGLPHTVTISQTATPQGFVAAESIDQEAVAVFPVGAGPCTITLARHVSPHLDLRRSGLARRAFRSRTTRAR